MIVYSCRTSSTSPQERPADKRGANDLAIASTLNRLPSCLHSSLYLVTHHNHRKGVYLICVAAELFITSHTGQLTRQLICILSWNEWAVVVVFAFDNALVGEEKEN